MFKGMHKLASLAIYSKYRKIKILLLEKVWPIGELKKPNEDNANTQDEGFYFKKEII